MLVKYTKTSIVDDDSDSDEKLPIPTPAKFDSEVADILKNELPGDKKPQFVYCHGTQDNIPVHIKLHDTLDKPLLKKHKMSMTTRRISFPYTMSSPLPDNGRIPTARMLGTDSITLWSDGSQAYTGNGAIAFGSCGIAYAFSLKDKNGNEKRYGYSGSYVDTSATNTDAEIMSAASGIREAICRGYRNVEVRYDAMSIVDTICTPGGTDTQCCFNSFLRVACRYANVTFTHVKGHSGIPMNEYVDMLAKSARNAGITFYSPLMKDTHNDITLSIPIIDTIKPGSVTQISKERNLKFERALSKLPNLPGMQAHRRKNGTFDYLSALTAVVGQNRINDSFKDNVTRYPYQKASGIGESGGKIIRMFVSGMSPKVVNAERKKSGIQDVSDLPAIMSQSTWILTRGAMRANSVQALVSGALSYSSGIPFPDLQQSVIDAVDAEQKRIDGNRSHIAASKQNKRTRKAAAKQKQQQQKQNAANQQKMQQQKKVNQKRQQTQAANQKKQANQQKQANKNRMQKQQQKQSMSSQNSLPIKSQKVTVLKKSATTNQSMHKATKQQANTKKQSARITSVATPNRASKSDLNANFGNHGTVSVDNVKTPQNGSQSLTGTKSGHAIIDTTKTDDMRIDIAEAVKVAPQRNAHIVETNDTGHMIKTAVDKDAVNVKKHHKHDKNESKTKRKDKKSKDTKKDKKKKDKKSKKKDKKKKK